MRTSSILSTAVACATMVNASLPVLSPLSSNAFDHVNDTQAIEREGANGLAARAWDQSKVATDAVWNTYVQKGQRLKCLMEAPDQGAGWLLKDTRTPPSAASKWSGDLTDDLRKWYWHESTVNQDCDCDWEKQRLKAAFEGVGLNSKQSTPPANDDNTCYRIEHESNPNTIPEQKYKVDEKEFTATGALYWFAINQKGGAIIGRNLENPQAAAKWNWETPATPDQLPDLRFCSDIYWAYWSRANPNVKNLRIYAAHNVVNDETAELAIRAILKNGHERITPWPGVSFDVNSPEGQALIGSPIGATIAHMLIGHKAELGIKWVRKVEVFTNDKRPDGIVPKYMEIHMFFHIEDVPVEEVVDPEKEKEKEEKKPGGVVGNGVGAKVQSRMVNVRNGGKDVVREHVFRL